MYIYVYICIYMYIYLKNSIPYKGNIGIISIVFLGFLKHVVETAPTRASEPAARDLGSFPAPRV